MSKQKILSPEEFRKMQLVELDMLVEFDRVCRKNDINYVIYGGTMLGAIRHKGFIPWDDDIDIGILREDYEKFKEHMDELDPKICYFQDHTTDKEYRWGYGKIRRTGTKYVRVGQEHLKFKTGIFIDVFPLDDIPKTTIGQMLQDFKFYCLRKILWSEVGKYSTKGFMKVWYTLLSKIDPQKVHKYIDRTRRKSKNSSSNMVRTLLFTSTGKLYRKNPIKMRYGIPKRWILDRAEYEFEGHKFYGTKDYDEIMKYTYGDYMKLPPEDQRYQHSPFSEITFPDEEKKSVKKTKKKK